MLLSDSNANSLNSDLKPKKINLINDTELENNFKQVEDNLINLSKVLSSVYLSTLLSNNQSTQVPSPPIIIAQQPSSNSVSTIA